MSHSLAMGGKWVKSVKIKIFLGVSKLANGGYVMYSNFIYEKSHLMVFFDDLCSHKKSYHHHIICLVCHSVKKTNSFSKIVRFLPALKRVGTKSTLKHLYH